MHKATIAHVRTDTDLVFVRDIALSNSIVNDIDKLDLSNIDWKTVGYFPTGENYFHNGFNKTFECYLDGKFNFELAENIYPYLIEEFKKLDPDASVKEIIRAQMTYTTLDGKMRDADIHQDNNNLGAWSFLLYLKGNSGNTDFNASLVDTTVLKTVNIKPYKLVIFPSLYAHQGHIPTDNADRLVMNFVIYIDTVLNYSVLNKSANSIKKIFEDNK
jgi:hypothetical protein